MIKNIELLHFKYWVKNLKPLIYNQKKIFKFLNYIVPF